jgi:hypothetical protein
MFSVTPGVALVVSEPPVLTCISSKESKSKYAGVEPRAAMSVMTTPSTAHTDWSPPAPGPTNDDC